MRPHAAQALVHPLRGRSLGPEPICELYKIWRSEVVGKATVFSPDAGTDRRVGAQDQWPPEDLPDRPMVMVANHPFGIGDGIAVLALAEQLGRPFRVLINVELLKMPEMRPYSLPIAFEETKEALTNNLAARHEAVKLLKEGVTIVIFPAGGVATAPKGFGQARRPAVEDVSGKAHPGREGERNAGLFLRPERLAVPSRQQTDEPGRAGGRMARWSARCR